MNETTIICVTSYVISVIFAVVLQVVLFRAGLMRRELGDTDASLGADIFGVAIIWPVILCALCFVWVLEKLGRLTRE